ncbi:MAG: hypothetical protein ABI538_06015 [Pseudoxanthomonas sp.]
MHNPLLKPSALGLLAVILPGAPAVHAAEPGSLSDLDPAMCE